MRERFMLYLGVSEVVEHEQVAEFCTECGGGGDAAVCFGNLVPSMLFVEKLHERNAWTSRSSTQHARTATGNNQLIRHSPPACLHKFTFVFDEAHILRHKMGCV